MNLTDIIVAVIGLIAAVISSILVPYLKKKFDTETYSQIQFWATIGVEAAEMIYNQSGMGKEKKEYVVEFLKSRGYRLDQDTIDKVIEAAVLELKQAIAE